MASMTQEQRDRWQGQLMEAVIRFRKDLYTLNEKNPWPDTVNVLDAAMMDLMTELWDWNFSITDIERSFRSAASDVRRYSAGHERRDME